MSDQASSFEREVRDTIVKSGLTGVAATVLAVTIFSPAGIGGMIGTSLASSFGNDPNTAPADNPYANLPAYPSPLTAEEISNIRSQLASTAAVMEFNRAATDAKIEHMRAIALTNGVVTFTPMAVATQHTALAAPVSQPQRQRSLSEPASAPAPTAVQANLVPVSYRGGGYSLSRHNRVELAEQLLAHEDL